MAYQHQPEGQQHSNHHHHHSKRSRINMLPLLLVGVIAASGYWMTFVNSDPPEARPEATVGEMQNVPAAGSANSTQNRQTTSADQGLVPVESDATAARGGPDATR